MLLDEPTSGVDPLARARLWETIGEAAAAGAGALVTTHYMEEAEECSRLVVMASGRVVAAGTAAQIVGPARTAVVRAADWAAALRWLEAAGLRAVLAGQVLRVPGPPGRGQPRAPRPARHRQRGARPRWTSGSSRWPRPPCPGPGSPPDRSSPAAGRAGGRGRAGPGRRS